MSFYDIPFVQRLLLLVLLASVVVAWDLRRRGREARRWTEYLFLLGSGGAGAVFGVLNDLVTSHVSPEYFTLGKGIAAGEGFVGRVVQLGAEAGFVAAVVAAGLYLLANNPRRGRPSLPYRRLVRLSLRTLAVAAMSGAALGAVVFLAVPEDLSPGSGEELSPTVRHGYLVVWSIHLGLYLGLGAAVVWGLTTIIRGRAALPPEAIGEFHRVGPCLHEE